MSDRPTIGVVGGTGAVGSVTLELLEARGYDNVRVFASARSAGKQLGPFTVEEAKAAREAFITGAGTLVLPVVRVDGAALGDGTPGPVAQRLRRLYIEEARRTAW